MGVKSQNLQKTIKIRVSEHDAQAMQAAASATRQTISGWARAVLAERLAELKARKVIT
jgi:uncharacterized protein (DUF1778 family)